MPTLVVVNLLVHTLPRCNAQPLLTQPTRMRWIHCNKTLGSVPGWPAVGLAQLLLAAISQSATKGDQGRIRKGNRSNRLPKRYLAPTIISAPSFTDPGKACRKWARGTLPWAEEPCPVSSSGVVVLWKRDLNF